MPLIKRRDIPQQPSDLPSDLHPVLKRIYAARQVTNAMELEHSLNRLQPYHLLKGMMKNVPWKTSLRSLLN